MTPFTLLATLALAASTLAAPATQPARAASPNELIVLRPKITSPRRGDLWPVGSTQTVTWMTDSIPPDHQNATGEIMLGHNANDSENLEIDHPLAKNFLLTDGRVNITVPSVQTRFDYIVVLYGDSGNASPEFTIMNIPASGDY